MGGTFSWGIEKDVSHIGMPIRTVRLCLRQQIATYLVEDLHDVGRLSWGNLGDGAPDGGGYHSARQIDKLDRVLVGNLPEVDAGKRRRNALCENDDPIACSTSAQPWMLAGSSLHVLTTSAESRRGTCVLVDRYALNQHQSPAGKGASSLEDDLGSARVC